VKTLCIAAVILCLFALVLSCGDDGAKNEDDTFQVGGTVSGLTGALVLQNNGSTTGTLEERLQVALSQQKLLLERNLGILGTMAAVAPLVGLLGTVWGIMRAFNDMSATGTAAPSVVAAGVAEALVTTAAGLIIAVPALMLYNHLSRRMGVMLTVAENHARSLRLTLIDGKNQVVTDTPSSSSSERAEPEPTIVKKEIDELEPMLQS